MESVQIGMDNVPLIAVTLVLMAGYVVLMLGTDTRIPGNSQIKLLLGATCIPALSGGASFGLLGYFGLGMTVLGTMVPFLGLAVGVDVIFLLVSSVNAVGPDVKDMEEVMVRALPRGGVAATTTTLTSVSAFTIAAATSTDLPGFLSFNLGLVMVLILSWIGMLIMLPAMITLNQTQHDRTGGAAKWLRGKGESCHGRRTQTQGHDECQARRSRRAQSALPNLRGLRMVGTFHSWHLFWAAGGARHAGYLLRDRFL